MITPSRAAKVETQLRCAGERQLVGQHSSYHEAGIADLAQAVVALGELPRDTAQSVVDEYALALSYRGQGPPPIFRKVRAAALRGTQPEAVLTLPTVFHINQLRDVAGSSTLIRSVLLSPDSCQVSVEWDEPPTWGNNLRGRRQPVQGGPTQMRLTDDRGAQVYAHFSGGGGNDGWEGSWTSHDPLSVTTAWIELDGVRIELPEPVSAAEVRIEELEPRGPVHRYLWHQLGLSHRHAPEDDPVLDFLWHLGLVDPDDPEDAELLDALHRVREAHNQGHALTKRVDAVPPEWQRLLSKRPRGRGPTGRAPLAAVTPSFDGVQCAIHELCSDREGFSVQARVLGSTGPRFGMFDDEIGTTSPVWWANDDRGNSYLGQWNGHSSGHGECSGTLLFGPHLDPRATRLEICPTTLHHRAVISVPLPLWTT